MKIAAASVQMQASHLATQRMEVSERLEAWVGQRRPERGDPSDMRPAAPPRPEVALSSEGRAAHEAEATASDSDPLDSDPQLRVLARMIELITGRPLRLLRTEDFAAGNASSAPAAGQAGGPDAARPAGFGIEYDFHAHYQESEQVSFAAQGVVRTADGREIRFDVAFHMERHYAESVSVQWRAGDARLKDPLVLDFAGPAAALSDVRFSFDLDADGKAENIPLIGGGRGLLAFDRNGNGAIDDGRELFGPTSGNGFAELAALDADGNGWIDEADPAWTKLRVWRPAANGPGTVQTLAEAGVGAIGLAHVATPFDLRGSANQTLGVMRASGVYLREDGSAGTVSQIDLSV